MNPLWHNHTVEYYTAIKTDKLHSQQHGEPQYHEAEWQKNQVPDEHMRLDLFSINFKNKHWTIYSLGRPISLIRTKTDKQTNKVQRNTAHKILDQSYFRGKSRSRRGKVIRQDKLLLGFWFLFDGRFQGVYYSIKKIKHMSECKSERWPFSDDCVS